MKRRIGTSAIARVSAMLLVLLACYAASAFAAFTVARQIEQNSDTVASFLAAQSILHGNLLLTDWHFARDNFFFTDTFPFAAFEGVFGSRTIALAAIPALVFALIVAACLAASLRSLLWSRDNLVSLATILLLIGLIGLPPTGLGIVVHPYLVPDMHGASILFALAALMLLSGIAKSGPIQHRPLRVSAFAILAITAVASDPFAIVFAFGPALLVLGVEFLAAERVIKSLSLIALVALSSALGLFLPAAIAHLGGFVTWPSFTDGFVPAEHLGHNLATVFFGFLDITGTDIFGKPALEVGTIANLARLAAWLLGGVAILRQIPLICHPGSDGLFDRFLLASLAVVVSACVFSRQFDDQGEAGVRYLAPVVVFAAILSARAMPQMIAALPTRRLRLAATVCFVTLAGGLLIGHTKMMLASLGTSPPWTARNGFLAVGRWLAAHHLTCGVGDYWSSSIITALTRGNVTVRAVWSAPEGHLVPVRWIDDDNWYRGTNTPSFAIWQERRESIPMQHVDAQAVAATYGTPLRLEHIADFTIAVLPLHSPQPGLTLRCPFADEALTPLPSPPNR